MSIFKIFLVCIFPYLDCIFTYLFVFITNAGKMWTKKLTTDTFDAVFFWKTGISRENIIRKIFVYFFIDFFVDFTKNRMLGMRSYSNCSRALLNITISDLSMILYLHHCSEVNIRQYSNVKN